MEIYKDTKTTASKEFEKLLNNQISKTKNLIEGKIVEGVVTKISEKYVFTCVKLFVNGVCLFVFACVKQLVMSHDSCVYLCSRA